MLFEKKAFNPNWKPQNQSFWKTVLFSQTVTYT
jgi:hypothetical protein